MVTAVMHDSTMRYRARPLPGHASIDNGRLCTRHCIQRRHTMRASYYFEPGSRFKPISLPRRKLHRMLSVCSSLCCVAPAYTDVELRMFQHAER